MTASSYQSKRTSDMSAVRMTLNPLKAGDVIVKGIIFDMDGTLCQPQTWMFGRWLFVRVGNSD